MTSSSSSIILFTASCSLVLLRGSGSIPLADALLIASSIQPSLSRKYRFALYQYRLDPDFDFVYDGFRQDGTRNPYSPESSNAGLADGTHPFVQSGDGDVDFDEINDYIESRRATRNSSRKEEKSTKFSDSISDIFSKVFPNQQQKLQPHISSPAPVSPRTIPNLPKIKISNEDIEKFTNQAKAGGVFFSNLMKEAFVHTAKLAIDAIEKSSNKIEMETTTYNDVCDFDDELCREIEDALEATNSFKTLVEDSNKSMPPDFNSRIIEQEDKRMDSRDEKITKQPKADIAGKYFAMRSVSDNARATVGPNTLSFTPERDTNNTGNYGNRFEEHYKRSLEQELLGLDERKPQDLHENRNYLNDAEVEQRGRAVLTPKNRLTRQDKVSPSRTVETPIERSKKGAAESSDHRQKLSSRSNTDNEPSAFDQMRRASPGRINQGPSLLQPEQETQSPIVKEPYVERDRKRLDNQGGYRPKLRSLIDADDLGVSNRMREHPRDSDERYPTNDPVKVDITDEALAFVRSLNLDVYEIYLSIQNPGSGKGKGEAVVALDDVIWYCERMQIGPRSRHRSSPSLARFNTDETGYTGANTAMASNEPTQKRNNQMNVDYHFSTEDRAYSSHRESTYNVASDKQRTGERDRVPRFRQYPGKRIDSSGPLEHSVGNNARDTRAPASARVDGHDLDKYKSVQSLGGIGHQVRSKSSMSQLIDYNSRRRHEHRLSSNDHNRNSIRSKRYSSVPLAHLVQKPRESSHHPFDQVSTNSFREPYEGGAITPGASNRVEKRLNSANSLRYHSEHTPSMTSNAPQQQMSNSATASTRDNKSAYCTNEALRLAEKWNIDLRKVAAASDEAITADDVRHYIESRKQVRATQRQQDARQRTKSTYIDNDLTYEQFASYFDTDTLNMLHQQQTPKRDPSEMV
jgi:hypothetical protein